MLHLLQTENPTSSQLVSTRFFKPQDDYQDKFPPPFTPFFSAFPPPPLGLPCFISKLINSSEVQPFTLNPHLPVHMATGWPHSPTPTPSTPARRQTLTPAATHKPLYLNYTLNTQGKGGCSCVTSSDDGFCSDCQQNMDMYSGSDI